MARPLRIQWEGARFGGHQMIFTAEVQGRGGFR